MFILLDSFRIVVCGYVIIEKNYILVFIINGINEGDYL